MADPSNPTKLVWDFEVAEQKRFPNRHVREVRPHLQSKDRDASAKGWVKTLRQYWEAVSNAAMEDAGLKKRYDARTYKEMGIALEPLKHIPSKTFNKERKGELTPDGIALARRQWDVVLEKVIAENFRMTALRRRNIAKNAERVERLITRMNPNKALASREVQRIAKIADKYAVLLGMAELCQDITRVVVDRVASRAKLVFHAAFGDTGKKPRGRPRKNPLPLKGPAKALPSEAEEARLFLKTVIPEAQRLDRRNRDEMHQVRQRLAIMSQRLEHFERDPAQHPQDRRRPGYVDLDRFDPSPEELARQREETMQRFQESVGALAERNLSEALKAAVNEASPLPPTASVTVDTPTAAPVREQPSVPAPAPAPEVAPTAAPAAPARGPGSRPAYLDEKNPKGTRFRYEPFSYRPDRPQNTKSRASTWKPSGPKLEPVTPQPTPAATAVKPAVSAPATQPQATRPPTASTPPVAANPPARANTPSPAAALSAAPRAEVPKPVVTAKPVAAPTAPVAAKPSVPREAPQPAVPKIEKPVVRAPERPATPAPAAKPEPRGTVTLTQKPVLPPKIISGMIIEGKKTQPLQVEKTKTETSIAPPATDQKASKSEQMTLPLGRPEQPVPSVPTFPKKPSDKKGRKKGPDRNEGPER